MKITKRKAQKAIMAAFDLPFYDTGSVEFPIDEVALETLLADTEAKLSEWQHNAQTDSLPF